MVIDAPEQPRSMVLTEFHFVLLYSDRIRIIGRLDDRVVHEEVLDLVSLRRQRRIRWYNALGENVNLTRFARRHCSVRLSK